MKKLVTIALAAAMTLTASAAQKQKQQAHGYPISPVPFTAVKVTPGTFLGTTSGGQPQGHYPPRLLEV